MHTAVHHRHLPSPPSSITTAAITAIFHHHRCTSDSNQGYKYGNFQDERELNRQRRKQSNRESAHRFRLCKKSYAAILYLNLPNRFRVILRGKEIIHNYNIVDDMMLTRKIMYKPMQLAVGTKNDQKVDLRAANNTEIMLIKVKMMLSDMMAATLAMDESILDVDQVEKLIKFCPTKVEVELLK